MDSLKKFFRINIKIVILLIIILFATLSFTTEGFLPAYDYLQSKNDQEHKEIKNMERYGKVIKVKPEKLDYYKKLHAEPWPEVLKAIKECNLRNFSIYYRDGYLFSYYEYIGEDYDSDMKKLSEMTKDWLKETDPCQVPVETAKEGEWWAEMEEVFHTN